MSNEPTRKALPVLFSGAMVRAILDGTKTQTRREVKAQSFPPEFHDRALDVGVRRALDELPRLPCPYGAAGDRLRVKEAAWMFCERQPNGKTPTGRDKWLYVPLREAGIFYAADHPGKPSVGVVHPETGNAWGWRLKIGRFLPAWASRITLDVVGVRVERLQEITEADAIAEGIERYDEDGVTYYGPLGSGDTRPDREFRRLWDSINGDRPGCAWDDSPWVWVVSFRRLEAAK